MPIFTLLLCPIFILIILRSILLFFSKRYVKIIVSVLVSVSDILILYIICDFMGWYYPVSYYLFILLNISVIILINAIKYFIKSKHKLIIIFILSALVIALCSINIFKYTIERNNIITANSDEIINNFNIHGMNAGKEYKGKTVEIKGIIIDMGSPKDWRPLWDASYIYFGDDINQETKIVCYFDNIIVHDLKIGQEITVRCKFKEYIEYNSEYTSIKDVKFVKGKIIE